MKSVVLALLGLCVTCIATGAAAADLVITVEYRDMGTTPPTVEEGKIFLAGDKLKMDMNQSVSGDQMLHSSMIYRGDQGQVTILEHDREMYTVIDKQAMAAVSDQLTSAMQQMEEQMSQMPEEQRQMMQKFMQGTMPSEETAVQKPTSKVEKTARREKLNGYDCVCYEVLTNGVKSSETWVASWGDVQVDKETFQVFHDMAAFYRGLLESLPGAAQQMPDRSFFDGIVEIDGFPILIREFEGTTITGETLFKSIDKQPIAPETFEVPARYKKQEMFGRG